MPLLLATLALASLTPTPQAGKFLQTGPMTAPKPGALGKIPKIAGLGSDRPRIALLPLWVVAPVPSDVATASAKALVDAAPTLEKTSKLWGFVNTKFFHKKIEKYAATPGGPWEAPEVDKIAASMNADYVGRLIITTVSYFNEDAQMGASVYGFLTIRSVKTSEGVGAPFLGTSSVTIGQPKAIPTIADAVYDLVAVRLADPETLGQTAKPKQEKLKAPIK